MSSLLLHTPHYNKYNYSNNSRYNNNNNNNSPGDSIGGEAASGDVVSPGEEDGIVGVSPGEEDGVGVVPVNT